MDLLLKLKEPGKELCLEYLTHCDAKLGEELEMLKHTSYQDLIEFVDSANSGFLSDMQLFVQSYGDMFFRSDLRFVFQKIDCYTGHRGQRVFNFYNPLNFSFLAICIDPDIYNFEGKSWRK